MKPTKEEIEKAINNPYLIDAGSTVYLAYKEAIISLHNLADSVENEFQFVRDKYGVEGHEFTCPYFQDMAIKKIEAEEILRKVPSVLLYTKNTNK